LVLHEGEFAGREKTLEVATLVYEFAVDVFVNAGHAEYVPTVVDVEEDVAVEVLVVLSVTVSALYDFG
jgi:hypothetical protein